MSTNCCVPGAPHTHGGFKVLGKATNVWQERLQAGLGRVINASDQTMGHLEEEILQRTRELERAVLEEASQKKADLTPPVCPGRAEGTERTQGTGTDHGWRFIP